MSSIADLKALALAADDKASILAAFTELAAEWAKITDPATATGRARLLDLHEALTLFIDVIPTSIDANLSD